MSDPFYTSKNCCPELWKELHLRAIQYNSETSNITDEKIFINRWGQRIPVKGCRCKDFWFNWYKSNQIDINDYFAWTVKAHNAVNTKLNKPNWTVEQAKEHWSKIAQEQ